MANPLVIVAPAQLAQGGNLIDHLSYANQNGAKNECDDIQPDKRNDCTDQNQARRHAHGAPGANRIDQASCLDGEHHGQQRKHGNQNAHLERG